MGLHDIYYAGQQIAKALPSMIEQVTNRDFRRDYRFTWKKPKSKSTGLKRVQEARQGDDPFGKPGRQTKQ